MQLAGILALSQANKLTRVVSHGLPITIEHPKGTVRELKNSSGKTVYKKHMHHAYGFFNGTKGRDGDEVDCFIGPMKQAQEVFIVHMKDMGPDKSEREDEDKCFIGFPSADAAKQSFLLHYPKSFYDGMTSLPLAVFKRRMRSASLPYRRKKITASKRLKCPKCGSKEISLMPTDFETAKCRKCGKLFDANKELKTQIAPLPNVPMADPRMALP